MDNLNNTAEAIVMSSRIINTAMLELTWSTLSQQQA